MLPNAEQARQFAQMLLAGVPAREAVVYFFPVDDPPTPELAADAAKRWGRCQLVLEAMVVLQGGEWTKLSAEKRIELALSKTYNEAAYVLYTNNYAEADGMKASRMDRCREMLEKKLAGLAGQLDPLQRLYDDLIKVRVGAKNAPTLTAALSGGQKLN